MLGGVFGRCNLKIRRVVNIEVRSRTCRMWQLSGVPCNQAIVSILEKRRDPLEFADAYYHHKMTHLKSYQGMIHPVPDKRF